jgi:hypothetical protein
VSCVPTVAALQFGCSQQLFGVTAARALVTVSTTTAALTHVCTFTTQPDAIPQSRVIAFIDDVTLVHFVGTASPAMERLPLANTGSRFCNVVAVAAYRTAALAAFDGTPVFAAHRDVNSATPRVLVVAASPSKLFAVTADGTVTLVASLARARDGAGVAPYALFVTGAATTVCGIPPGECSCLVDVVRSRGRVRCSRLSHRLRPRPERTAVAAQQLRRLDGSCDHCTERHVVDRRPVNSRRQCWQQQLRQRWR